MTEHFTESAPPRTLRGLADALDGFACVLASDYVQDDPCGPAVEVTFEPWCDGLVPVVVQVADGFDARVRRFEPRGKDLPDRALIW